MWQSSKKKARKLEVIFVGKEAVIKRAHKMGFQCADMCFLT